MTTPAGPVFRSDMTVDLVRGHASDADVLWAARVSTLGDQTRDADAPSDPARDAGLIRYLMTNRHGTPFEHNSFTFYIEAPIFVFREFHRHRIGWSYNEVSGRYRELAPTFYVPDADRPLVQVGKTGHYTFVPGTPEQTLLADEAIRQAAETAYAEYQRMLAAGIAKEVARAVLPVGTYSAMYATCNARSLMAFLSLRTHDDESKFPSYPQAEIEMVATKMEQHFASLMPITHAAFAAAGRVCP